VAVLTGWNNPSAAPNSHIKIGQTAGRATIISEMLETEQVQNVFLSIIALSLLI
jgi:hypothetical protein